MFARESDYVAPILNVSCSVSSIVGHLSLPLPGFYLGLICGSNVAFFFLALIDLFISDTTKTIADRAASREINKLEVECPFGCGAGSDDSKKLLIRNLEVSNNIVILSTSKQNGIFTSRVTTELDIS